VNAIQVLFILMLLVLWVWLHNSWRLRNWRAVALGGAGTFVILAAGFLPNPARGLVQGGVWLALAWIFVIRPDLVGVMGPEEYIFVDEHDRILRRIAERKHSGGSLEPESTVRAFEADIRAMESLTAPPAWSHLHKITVRELNRRLTMMKLSAVGSSVDVRTVDERWLEVGQEFRALLETRAGFWAGAPNPFRHPESRMK
jgi:hypothetical protein